MLDGKLRDQDLRERAAKVIRLGAYVPVEIRYSASSGLGVMWGGAPLFEGSLEPWLPDGSWQLAST